MKRKAGRIATVIVSAAFLLWLVLSIAREYQTSSLELKIAVRVVESGGHVLRARTIDELVETHIVAVDKPVLLETAESKLAHMTHDRLGFRIRRAIFFDLATTEQAAIVNQSTGLTMVAYVGHREANSNPPLRLVHELQGRFLQRVGFDHYAFSQPDIVELSQLLNTPSIVFGLCKLPAKTIRNLNSVKGLREVAIVNCTFDGSTRATVDAIEALRRDGINVVY